MRVFFKSWILLLLTASYCFSQEPVPILGASWERVTIRAEQPRVSASGPAKPVLPENKYFQRKAREQRTDNPMDPYEASIEGRSAAMDRAVQESRTPQPDDATGYSYVAKVRNDTGRTVAIIFWEYEFTEIAQPSRVVRRQFLCGVKVANGETKELSAFSLLAPSEVISAESLSATADKLFKEKVKVNRIEFADGAILQRDGWKYDDVRDAVRRATSTPWDKDKGMCRGL
jgi:hypothetical protein